MSTEKVAAPLQSSSGGTCLDRRYACASRAAHGYVNSEAPSVWLGGTCQCSVLVSTDRISCFREGLQNRMLRLGQIV